MPERIYGIYDKAAASILTGGSGIRWVMTYNNDNVARREFASIARQVPHIREHAGDYCLMRFGTIDMTAPSVTPEQPMIVMNAVDALNTDPRQSEMEMSTQGLPSAAAPETAPARRPMGVLESQQLRDEAEQKLRHKEHTNTQ